MPSPLQIAIIGCGSMGETHAACLSAIAGVKIRAFSDVDSDRAEALCRRYRADYATNDSGCIFRDDAIDAVYICTYHDTHSTLALQAAAAGKHAMIEKPLALTIAECYAIGNAVEKSGIKLMTGFKLRYYPSVAKVKQFIPRPIVTIAQMLDSRWPDEFWANDPVRGGGNILSQGCHTMDLVYYLNESEPVRIYAAGGNFTHPTIPIVDNLVATITFANGCVASVAQGDGGATPFVSKFSFQVVDGIRTAHLHNRLKSVSLFDGEKSTEYDDPEEYGLREENNDFIRALQTDQPPPISHHDGLRATLLVLRALESLQTGTPQKVCF